MLKLFLRLYLIVLCLLLLWFAFIPNLVQVLLKNPIRDYIVNSQAWETSQPTLNYLQTQLQQVPEAQWPAIIKSLTPTATHYPLYILPIDSIHLNPTQMERLQQGRIVGTFSAFGPPILNNNDGYNGVAYQRIGDSNQVLVFRNSPVDNTNYLTQQRWLLHFIELTLKQDPTHSEQALQDFSQTYQVPVQLLSLTSLTPAMQSYLQQFHVIYDMSMDDSAVSTLYYLETPTHVLRIGPYPVIWYMHNLNYMLFAPLVLGMALLSLLILFLLNRDFKKMARLAEAYGNGQFTYSVKVSRLSAMFPLYTNLKAMGQRIQKLITSHKELSQAISHELKTPLSRLKFALSLMEEAKNAKDRNAALDDAEAAGNALGDLVNELLLYTRFDREFFKPDTQMTDVQKSVNTLIHDPKYAAFGKTISWQIDPNLGETKIHMSEPYFKLLLENLLSNACRYASSKIEVQAYRQNQAIIFEVADDGPGIPEAYRQKIFEPFFSLDESRSKDLSGHGLGLAIVARIIETHQAKISVTQSDALGGALFVLSILTDLRG
ncbi:MAG: ATP-binding protein [Gammaproteobacteria bacterium]|nr:ATP-binding protein [Gammaproteobacteria bacterium]